MKPTLLIGAIGVAVTGLLGYNMVYEPYRRQVSLIRSEVDIEEATQRMQAEVAELLQQIGQYHKQLPPEPDPSWLIHEVVTLSQKAGVQLTTISQEPPAANDRFTRLGVMLQVSASYHQLGAFLDELEHSDHFIQIDRVDMRRLQDTGPVSIEVALSTFYLPSVVNAVSSN